MQQKKNIRLLILLGLLLVATGVVAWLNTDDGAVEIDKTIFRVEDFKTVDGFTFESKAGKVDLKYNGSRWKVNNKYDADRNLVDVLFATLQQAEPKRPVASALKDSLAKVLVNDGVKVSLYAKENTLESFYAGGNGKKTQAYFKQVNDHTPYVMIIPGYRVYASGIFELDENGWRDKRIFNLNWRNFKDLTTTFSKEPKQNYKVSFIDKYFGVEGMTYVDTTKLNNFLDAVSFINADQILKPGSSVTYDSLLKTQPVVTISVHDVAEKNIELSLYAPIKNDPYVLGRSADGEGVLFRRETITPIIKGRDYFMAQH
jgi:hypothetical protein